MEMRDGETECERSVRDGADRWGSEGVDGERAKVSIGERATVPNEDESETYSENVFCDNRECVVRFLEGVECVFLQRFWQNE